MPTANPAMIITRGDDNFQKELGIAYLSFQQRHSNQKPILFSYNKLLLRQLSIKNCETTQRQNLLLLAPPIYN
jgi:hypothetical protein